MAILRVELVENGKPQLDGYGNTAVQNVYDILADEFDDLEALTSAGVGSMAYTRQASDGNQKWVLTENGWEAVDDAGDADEDDEDEEEETP